MDTDEFTHPLSERLIRWSEIAARYSPPVPFESAATFPKTLDQLQASDAEKYNVRMSYIASYLLARALTSHTSSNLDESLHRILYSSGNSTKDSSFPLCEAARIANNLQHHPNRFNGLKNIMMGFSHSLRLDGITDALNVWRENYWPSTGVDTAKETKYWVDKIEGSESSTEQYFELALRELSETENSFDEVAAKAQRAKYERERTKKKGEVLKEQLSETKTFISLLWVPAALWCRDSYSIAMILGWDGKGTAKDADRRIKQVNDAVHKLGFSKSRRDYQVEIEKAERSISSK